MTRALRLALLGLLVIMPVVFVVIAASGGVLLSPDSVSYLAAARSLGSGQGLLDFDGQPLTLFPPGLPITLALPEAVGVSAETSAVALNCLSLAGVVVATYAMAHVILRRSGLVLAATAIVSLSASFTEIFAWFWSEPLFTMLLTTLLAVLVWAVEHRTAPWWLVVLTGLLVSAATSVRYVGYVLVPILALAVWWAARSSPRALSRRSAFARVILAVALGVAAPMFIALRNMAVGADPLGDRYPGVRTFQDSVAEALSVLGEFVVPSAPQGIAIVLGSGLLALIALAVWSAFIRRERAVLLLGVFVGLFTLAILWSQTATRLDPPTARLLGPALPAMAILVVMGLRVAAVRLASDTRQWAEASPHPVVRQRGATALCIGGWVLLGSAALVAAVASFRADVRLASETGHLGLRAPAVDSPLSQAAQSLADATGFASNDPWRMYVGLGTDTVVFLPPNPEEWPASRIERDADRVATAVRSGAVSHALVVEGDGRTQSWEALEAAGLTVRLVAETPEGDIYRLQTSEE